MIFHYSKNTGEFLYASEPKIDPLDPERILVPALATEITPPVAGPNEVAVFLAGQWAILDDYRGTLYWTADHEQHEIDEISYTVPAGASTEPPPTEQSILDGGSWREPNAQEIDEEKTRLSDFDLADDPLFRAFALVVLDEINNLRAQHGQNPRTVQQLKNAIKSKL